MIFNNLLHALVSYRVPNTEDGSGEWRGTRWEKDNFWSAVFWRGVLAECLALALFIPIAPGSSVGWSGSNAPSNTLIALANGLAIATLIQCFSHVSGAQFNPALTVPLAVYRQISVFKALCYVVAQCLGSAGGAAILRFVTPRDKRAYIGMTRINYDEGVDVWQGFVVEFVITFHLVLMYFATIDPRRKDVKGSAALGIGLAVATGLLYGIPYTGASMNPARSFGPALVAWEWTDHWVYWASPIGAGVAAASIYKCLFAEKAAILRPAQCCRRVDRNGNDPGSPEGIEMLGNDNQGIKATHV